MTTAGKEEALLPNDSQGKKQPEVFGSVQSGFVSNHHPDPWTPRFAFYSHFFHQPTSQKLGSIIAEHCDKDQGEHGHTCNPSVFDKHLHLPVTPQLNLCSQ